MSELREECYKCLNNHKCLGGAEYGSIYCMMNRKFKIQSDDIVYAAKFELMQQQIDKKDKRIKELEEENAQLEAIKDEAIKRYNFESIPVQKVKVKIEELDIAILECEYDDDDVEEYKNDVEKEKRILLIKKSALEELLEEK